MNLINMPGEKEQTAEEYKHFNTTYIKPNFCRIFAVIFAEYYAVIFAYIT